MVAFVAVSWAVLALAVTVVVSFLRRFNEKRRIINKIPGLPAYPLVGNALQLKSDAAEFFQQTIDLAHIIPNEGVTRTWIGPIPMVNVHCASAVEAVLSGSKHIDKSPDYLFLQPWLGLGLLTSTGEKWRNRRHTLTPTFHFDILKEFFPIISRHANTFIDKLSALTDESFNIYPYVTRISLDVICETAMGINMDAQNDYESEYVRAVYRASELIAARQRRPWLWGDLIYYLLPQGRDFKHCLDVLHSFTNKVIHDRQAEFAAAAGENVAHDLPGTGTKKRRAFLDLLLQCSFNSNGQLTLEDIREEVDTFMFEGHDTTSAGIAWSIFLIGRHPEVQARIHQELDEIFGSTLRDVEHDDLRRMTYLECAIKEALRLYPPVPWYARTLTEDAVLGGFHVPKATAVLIVATILHRDEAYFPDPEKYDPERFNPENSARRHPFAYLPFSAGPRNCIGQKFAMMELKVVLATLFRNYSVQSMQLPPDAAPVSELILKPSLGIQVRLSAR